jgi:hypothetical protein
MLPLVFLSRGYEGTVIRNEYRQISVIRNEYRQISMDNKLKAKQAFHDYGLIILKRYGEL